MGANLAPDPPEDPMSSSKKDAKRSRNERLEAARKQQQAAERRRSLILYGAAALALVIIAGAVFWAIVTDDSNDVARNAEGDIEGVQVYEYDGGNHVQTTVDYAESPPVGGEHNPVWLNCGVYTEPVPDEHAVHSLEHGTVWITYQPDLAEDQVSQLEDMLPDTYTLLSPYEGLESPIVISAWGHQLEVDSADDPRLEEFITEYRQGPQTPEPGAACTGGTDGTDNLIQG